MTASTTTAAAAATPSATWRPASRPAHQASAWCQPVIVAASAQAPAANVNTGSSSASTNRLSNKPVTLLKRVPSMSGGYQSNWCAARPRWLGQPGSTAGLARNDTGVPHVVPASR